ncbi:ATP-binding protein [Synoicihabitans lomoniglobus]|uniref:ATP-binding protein n=1 Tax=Synoicihabitans lomoniglobus TaxID=2909285 RepID=A0AAE9ZZA7_9BACT|nr:ATP-binding protein [Opitutaceae bacterium LMO-M01]WED64108.1 ATP-binding protein [Opitutaceae bacterium LMO-M01]
MVDPSQSPGVALSPADFGRLFPFYIEIGADSRVMTVGRSLARTCPAVTAGKRLAAVLEPIRPAEALTLAPLRNASNTLFLVRETATGLNLRGQWLALAHGGVVFLGSPWLEDTNELASRQLRVDDFAIHDPAVDLLQILRTQQMATADLRRLTDKLTAQRARLKEANARLTTQEAESRKLALIAERTDNAVILTDAEGKAEWINTGFTRLTGYTLDDVLGQRPGSLLQGPQTEPDQIKVMRTNIAKKQGFNVELINYDKSGRRYRVAIEAQPITNADGAVTHFMAIESDVTVQRAAEADLRVQFSVSQVLAEGASLAAVSHRILQIITTEFGWSLAQLWMHEAKSGHMVLTESWAEDARLLQRFLDTARQPKLACDVGLPGLTWQSQKNQWIERISDYPECPRSSAAHACGLHSAVAFPLHIGETRLGIIELMSVHLEPEDGPRQLALEAIGVQIAQFVARAHSREELKTRSEELVQVNERLATASRAKNAFLASISHEIRTPLNGVIGAVDVLAQSSLDLRQREALATLNSSSTHLHSLLNDVLDFSRIEAGHLELTPEPILVSRLVEDTVQIFNPIALGKKLEFKREIEIAADMAISIDVTRLRQILVNLLGNAFKFTDVGSVTLRLRSQVEGERIRLRFEVQDSGIGIPPDKASQLFKPFNQLQDNHTRNYGGTGLGLAISHQLVKLMHGAIELDTSVTPGSLFWFEIVAPLTTPPAAKREFAGRFAVSESILIVDDHPANAAVLQMLLKQLGLTGHHCDNANAALTYCHRNNPPAIMMDVHMPRIDGIETTRLIRESTPPDRPRVPIIALTADVRAEIKNACFEAGMDHFLSKPIRLADLRAILCEVIPTANESEDAPPDAPPTGAEPAAHGLDFAVADNIFKLGERPELSEEFAGMFASMWTELAPDLDLIEKLRKSADFKRGRACCHRMRGVLSTYGFRRAADLLGRMENDSAEFRRSANLSAVRALLEVGRIELFERFPYLAVAPPKK